MKKTMSALVMCASLTATVAEAKPAPKKEENRKPSSTVEYVGCQGEGIECVWPASSYKDKTAEGDDVVRTYCVDGSKVVQGAALNFCVVPKRMQL